jgi:hypothetical protein
MHAVQYATEISAYRRELNSHKAAKPRGKSERPCMATNKKSESSSRRPVAEQKAKYEAPVCVLEALHCVGKHESQSLFLGRRLVTVGWPHQPHAAATSSSNQAPSERSGERYSLAIRSIHTLAKSSACPCPQGVA